MTVNCWPLRVSCLPMMFSSAPKRLCQSAWLMIATGVALGLIVFGEKVAPANGLDTECGEEVC